VWNESTPMRQDSKNNDVLINAWLCYRHAQTGCTILCAANLAPCRRLGQTCSLYPISYHQQMVS